MSVRRRFLSPSPPPRKHREGYAIHKRRHHLSLQHDPRRCSCPTERRIVRRRISICSSAGVLCIGHRHRAPGGRAARGSLSKRLLSHVREDVRG
ncbi:hypothetical protein PAHAL_5G465200 [Panicum hallii]|uniref:Uncharacterized protein n=1 Tax=Panicum hallii TaxID=206008 RepID=A0A2T8INK9_9POAL|nr:hypothetical protein PAHAL_5G465200 [Panicum hallii]